MWFIYSLICTAVSTILTFMVWYACHGLIGCQEINNTLVGPIFCAWAVIWFVLCGGYELYMMY